jgi:hypothetical protein
MEKKKINTIQYIQLYNIHSQINLSGLSPREKYTDRATAACRRS